MRPQWDQVSWIERGRLLACVYPRTDAELGALTARGVTLVVNLHERAHDGRALTRRGLEEVHLPVTDFTPPSPAQLATGVEVIQRAVASGRIVAVHCGAGLGRTGTLLACYLVRQGQPAGEAIARIRALRPGSVETEAQVAAVVAYSRRCSEHGQPYGLSEDGLDDDHHTT